MSAPDRDKDAFFSLGCNSTVYGAGIQDLRLAVGIGWHLYSTEIRVGISRAEVAAQLRALADQIEGKA